MLKTLSKRVGLIVAAWLIGSTVFGFIPMLLGLFSLQHFEMYQRLQNGYEAFGVWVVYRIGARLLHLSPPSGLQLALIRLTWCFFAYVLVGGSVEVAIGRPTIAAGLSGIPLAIVLYLLLARVRPNAPSPKPSAE